MSNAFPSSNQEPFVFLLNFTFQQKEQQTWLEAISYLLIHTLDEEVPSSWRPTLSSCSIPPTLPLPIPTSNPRLLT